MVEMASGVEELVLGLSGPAWMLVAVYVLVLVDGVFPPVPSEAVVIAVAALATVGEGPALWLLLAVAAAGALTGDVLAYAVGARLPVRRMWFLRSERGQAALAWAGRALASRGTVFILSARFVPIGRVAVTMTAGAVGYPRGRFVLVATVAGALWSGYTAALGIGAGVLLPDQPLVAIAVGAGVGIALGVGLDALLRRWQARTAAPSVPEQGVAGTGP